MSIDIVIKDNFKIIKWGWVMGTQMMLQPAEKPSYETVWFFNSGDPRLIKWISLDQIQIDLSNFQDIDFNFESDVKLQIKRIYQSIFDELTQDDIYNLTKFDS